MVQTHRDQMWGWGGVQPQNGVHLTVETLCCVDASVSRGRDGGWDGGDPSGIERENLPVLVWLSLPVLFSLVLTTACDRRPPAAPTPPTTGLKE